MRAAHCVNLTERLPLLPIDRIAPGPARTLLLALLNTLSLVMQERGNKMSSHNLAIVFAPALLRREKEAALNSLMNMDAVTLIVRFMIRHMHCCQLANPSQRAWRHTYRDDMLDADDAPQCDIEPDKPSSAFLSNSRRGLPDLPKRPIQMSRDSQRKK